MATVKVMCDCGVRLGVEDVTPEILEGWREEERRGRAWVRDNAGLSASPAHDEVMARAAIEVQAELSSLRHKPRPADTRPMSTAKRLRCGKCGRTWTAPWSLYIEEFGRAASSGRTVVFGRDL